jgi:hypothetical protein
MFLSIASIDSNRLIFVTDIQCLFLEVGAEI